MVSMAIAKIGAAPPFFVERGAKISGETYLAHLAHNFFPAMSAIATKKNKLDTFSFQQDGATSHGVGAVIRAIKKNTGRPFPFSWPPRSPDVNPLEFYLWGVMETFIESMGNPPKKESELRTAAHLAADSIDPGELGRAIDNVYVRRKKCIEHDGARFGYALK